MVTGNDSMCYNLTENATAPVTEICGIGTDAVVDMLRVKKAAHMRYDKLDNCNAPHVPHDHSPRLADSDPQFWYSHGHDAWSKLYESEFFVNWLLGTESDDNATSLGFNV